MNSPNPRPPTPRVETQGLSAWLHAEVAVQVHEYARTGLSLTADERLQAGSEYSLVLEGDRGTLQGPCLWCHLVHGAPEHEPVYQAGIRFSGSMEADPARLGGTLVPALTPASELRQHPRYLCSPPLSAVASSRTRIDITTLSLSGLIYLSETMPAPERERRVAIEFPEGVIDLVGHSRSVRPTLASEGRRLFEVGFQFAPYPARTRQSLLDYINSTSEKPSVAL